jgi:membrane-associated phospholipid phosphatase
MLVVGILAALYVLIPASYPRPIITNTDISSILLKLTYEYDGSNNTFPSSHVALSLICVLTFINCKFCISNNVCKIIAWIWFFCVCASTLLLKQHHIVDVAAGIIISFGIFKIIHGSNYFKNLIY